VDQRVLAVDVNLDGVLLVLSSRREVRLQGLWGTVLLQQGMPEETLEKTSYIMHVLDSSKHGWWL
jgi:hypothetical protein